MIVISVNVFVSVIVISVNDVLVSVIVLSVNDSYICK